MAKQLNVSLEHHHRAVDDAEATAEIFLHMIKRLEDKEIKNLTQLNEACIPNESRFVRCHRIMLLSWQKMKPVRESVSFGVRVSFEIL